jgi:L-iditol 2-dehydrogenase
LIASAYDTQVRAVVLDEHGQPAPADLPEPEGNGALVRVLACGLCGSDVEKIGSAPAGTVLGHEVVAELDGRRVSLVHHLSCGECERCLARHESTCEAFRAATIVPGGFAERARATETVELPDGIDDATATYVEPLACVLRAAERLPPGGRVLVVGNGFVGRLFSAVLERRGDVVFSVDRDPRRAGRPPDGPVDAAVLCAPGGATEATDALEPGGTLLVFAPSAPLVLDAVYRCELAVVGSRSATPGHMRAASTLLPELDLPEPAVLPLERFADGLDLYCSGEALKVVFTP